MQENIVSSNTKPETIIRDYVRVLFRYKWIFLISVIAIIPLVYIKQEMVTPYYMASVKMLVSGVNKAETEFYRELPMPGRFVAPTMMEFVKSRIVLERVVEALKLYERPLDFDEMRNATSRRRTIIKKSIKELESALAGMTPEQRGNARFIRAMNQLKSSISMQGIESTNMFIIRVKDFNPKLVPLIANSLSRSYIIFDIEQKIAELTLKYGEKHSSILQLKNYIDELKKTLDGKLLPDIEAMGPASVKVISQAQSVSSGGHINKRKGLILAFLISLSCSIAIAFILDSLSQTFRSPNDIEKHLKIPYLGSIPRIKTKNKKQIHNKYSAYYQNIVNRLDLAMKSLKIKSVVIADVEASDNTPVFVANAGSYFARSDRDRQVLIIDANIRTPSMATIFNLNGNPGLSDVLDGSVQFENAIKSVELNLHVLTIGQTGEKSQTLLDSTSLSDIIKKAQHMYDVVLVYGADIKNFTDSVKIASFTDAFLLVMNEGKVRRFIAKMAISPLEQENVRLLGAVLTNRKMVIPKLIYKWL